MAQSWLLAAALLLTISASSEAQSPSQPGSDASATARVLITVGGKGLLRQDRLTAMVENRPAAITKLQPAKSDPLVFAVLIDVSGSARHNESFERKWSFELIRKLLAGGNRGYFGDFNDEFYLSDKPATLESVAAELKQIGAFRGGTAFQDAVFRTVKLISKAAGQNERRALFLLTDGEDNASSRTLEEVTAEAQRSGVAVFCIAMLGPQTTKRGPAKLTALSNATGGRTFILNAPGDFLTSLIQDLNNQFWLTINLPMAADLKLHGFTLSTSEADLQISAPTQILAR